MAKMYLMSNVTLLLIATSVAALVWNVYTEQWGLVIWLIISTAILSHNLYANYGILVAEEKSREARLRMIEEQIEVLQKMVAIHHVRLNDILCEDEAVEPTIGMN